MSVVVNHFSQCAHDSAQSQAAHVPVHYERERLRCCNLCIVPAHERLRCDPPDPDARAVSDLSDFLNAYLGKRVADDIVRGAAKQGHVIDRSVVYAYLRGEHAKNPRQATLAALAAGFGVDVRTLRELAGKPAGELGPWTPTDESASLTRDQRDALDALIKVIVKGEADGLADRSEKTDDGDDGPVPVTPPPVEPDAGSGSATIHHLPAVPRKADDATLSKAARGSRGKPSTARKDLEKDDGGESL